MCAFVSVTSNASARPSRWIFSLTEVPAGPYSSVRRGELPSISVMRSPGFSPACSPGPPGASATTIRPFSVASANTPVPSGQGEDSAAWSGAATRANAGLGALRRIMDARNSVV